MAGVQLLQELAPDQSSDIKDNHILEQEESNTTVETSSIPQHSVSSPHHHHHHPLSWPAANLRDSSQAESTIVNHDLSEDEGEEDGDSTDSDDDDNDDNGTPRANTTRTHFVFTAKQPSSSTTSTSVPTSLPQLVSTLNDGSPSWLQQVKSFPPPLVPSSISAISASTLVSPTSQAQLKATTTTTAITTTSEGVVRSPATAVGAAQLPPTINAPFIYHLASPAAAATAAQSASVGGIRQSVLTPILTFLPNAQNLVAATATGTCSRQPVILSPPAAQALNMPLAAAAASAAALAAASSSSQAAIMSSFAQVKTNGVGGPHAAAAARVLSTEPTTGQQTLKSPIMECVTSTAMNRNPSPPRTLASIPLSEMTPQYSELKAFAEEFKNKRIRLGFTQGAVGQSLADKGYSNFAQSTISRFEQMQLSPTNAAAIKLVLEKWLQETENPDSAHSPSSSSPVMASRKRKRRAVFTPQTKTTLESYFKQNPRPNRHIIETVAQELDLLPEEVRVWFCNKRQKEKQGSSVSSSISSSGAAVQMTAYKYPSYDRESSVSLSSSGTNSPSSLFDNSSSNNFLKRNSPSPPRNSTPFTIEELSKSSSTGTKTITSPVCIANPFATSPQGVVMALTTPRISLAAPPSSALTAAATVPPTRIVLPQLQVAQTTA